MQFGVRIDLDQICAPVKLQHQDLTSATSAVSDVSATL